MLEGSGAHKCSVCDQFVHAVCGSYSEDSEGFGLEVTCNLCVRKNRINIEREGAKSGQEQQAQKNGFSLQLKISSSCYWDKRCGQGAWPWSRTSSNPRNVLEVVVDVICSGLYLLGTKKGLREGLYARNEFTTADNAEPFLLPTDAHNVKKRRVIKTF